MVTLTESAELKIKELLEDNQEAHLRVAVQGGGCSGFSYSFAFDDPQEDDFTIGSVLVDSMSMQYLQGATIDYKEELMGSSFVVNNPNATTTCGCGSSFSI